MALTCRALTVTLALLTGSYLPTTYGADAGPRPMTLVDLIELERAGDPLVADDGETVVFTLSEADWEQDRAIEHLWLRSADGEPAFQLTNGARGESGHAISPDGSQVVFVAERGDDETAQAYLISTRGGEAQRLTTHPTSVRSLRWRSDSSGIYFIADDSTEDRDKAREKLKDDMIRFDADRPHAHLWFQHLDGADAIRLTEGDFTITDFVISDDGDFTILSRSPTPYLDARWQSELYRLDLPHGSLKRLTDNDFAEMGVGVSADGGTVVFLAGASEGEEGGFARDYVNRNLFTLDLSDDHALTLHLPEQPFGVNAARFDEDGRIHLLVNVGAQNQLHRYDSRTGRLQPVLIPERATILDWHYNRTADVHVLRLGAADTPGELYSVDGMGDPVPFTDFYADLDDRFRIPEVRLIEFAGRDGVTVEGFLTLPLGYEEGERYPLVVQTHGGPRSSDQWNQFRGGRYTEVMAAQGYAVLEPNYRGSTGYGDPFLRDMIAANGGYFQEAHRDVMAGVDAVIDLGVADPDRLVKKGWSAGGHMTNKIITYTDRFSAASSGAGAVNWTSMVGQSDIRLWRLGWFDRFPHDESVDLNLYLENSPLLEMHEVTTPTLVLVGEKDVRVPPPQSQELFHALRANGVPTAFYIAPGEPHGWRRLSHRLFRGNVELEWFATHALGTDYQFEVPPFARDEADSGEE